MGYFSEQLDRLLLIESQGFNPYTETYSARIGQLQSDPVTDPTGGDNYDPDKANASGLNKDTTPAEKQVVIDKLNQDFSQENQLLINKDGGIEFAKEKPHVYKFEIGRNNAQKRDDKNVYLKRDLTNNTNIAYDTKEAYEEALKKYKEVTGIDTTNNL